MSWKRVKAAAKRVGGKIQDKAKTYGRVATPFAKKILLAPFGMLGTALGGTFGGGGGDSDDGGGGYRAMAAKRIQGTKRQAGAGQIGYNEEVWDQ